MTTSTNFYFVNYNSLGYGHRIGLYKKDNISLIQVNPRQEIGKIGIRVHDSRFSQIFHRCITIPAIESKTQKTSILHLNRSSAIEWFNAQVKDSDKLHDRDSDDIILSKFCKIEKYVIPSHPKSTLNHRAIHSLTDRIRAVFCKTVSLVVSSSPLFYALSLKCISERGFVRCSESLACSSFTRAIKDVKAYKDFVKPVPKTFNEIPVTSKDNYIKKYTQNSAFGELSLYHKGVIPKGSKKDTSTGTSGKPTSWYRGPNEIKAINRSILFSAKAVIGNRPYYLINGFALGPWATGIAISNAASNDPNCTVCNIGIDTKEIFQAIKDAAKTVSKDHPIVVAGYPPHLKEVVDLAIKEGFPLEKYNIIGIVGGEAMSENQRDLINCQKNAQGQVKRSGFRQCYSAYGASDLDVTIGYETDFAIELRKALHSNSELAKELLGGNDFIPMIFPYNPLNHHIETDDQQNLLFTCLSDDRISPRVRYNLGDRGKTMPLSDVLAIVQKHGIEIKNAPKFQLPLLFVWGRVGTHVSYEGLKIAPENLEDALRVKNLLPSVAHYGFLQLEKNGTNTSEILIELMDGVDLDANYLHREIVNGLKQYNQEFNKSMNEGRTPPALRIFRKGTSPMAIQRERYPQRKKQYIFNETDECFKAASISK